MNNECNTYYMNNLKLIFFILIISLTGLSGFAQMPLPDKVTGTASYLDTVAKYYAKENAYPFDLNDANLNARIPVRIHVIKTIAGTTGVNISDIESSLATANSFFGNIGMRFYIDSVNIINDYHYGFIARNHYRKELLTLYGVKNKINLFLADSIQMNPSAAEKTYGYTYFPDAVDSNYIFLDKKYAEGKYLTTMLGHFMGLLPTHETGKGMELASEKNCSSTGDFICDTYADPSLYNQVDTTCTYMGSARDNSGEYYVPTVANIMSNSPDECKCIFTPQQYRRMYFYFLKYRQKLRR